MWDYYTWFLTVPLLWPQGGRHADYVADQVTSKLIEVVKKKNKAGVVVKPFQVYLTFSRRFLSKMT